MKNVLFILALFALLLPVSGCDDDASTPTANDGPVVMMRVVEQLDGPPLVGDDCKAPTFTSTDPEILNGLTYETFSGTITPGQGGWLLAEPQTWPKGSTFTIMVPPGALPDDGTEPFGFQLQVPTYQSYLDNEDENDGAGLPLVMRLEPSHINFLEPVQIFATYMPWSDPGLDPADHTDWAPSCQDDSILWKYDARARKWRVRFEAPHFSDWEIEPTPR